MYINIFLPCYTFTQKNLSKEKRSMDKLISTQRYLSFRNINEEKFVTIIE